MAPSKIYIDNIEIKNNFEYPKDSEVANFFESYGLTDIKTIKLSTQENEISGVITANSGNIMRFKLQGKFSYSDDRITSADVSQFGTTSEGSEYFYGDLIGVPGSIDVPNPDQSWSWASTVNSLVTSGTTIASYDSYEDIRDEDGSGLAGLLSYFNRVGFDGLNPSPTYPEFTPESTENDSGQNGIATNDISRIEIGRLYTAAFGRLPDDSGIDYWSKLADDRIINYRGIANEFVNSEEFKSRFGENIPNEKFVSNLYQNILGRSPEIAGSSFWVNQLTNGLPRNEVLIGFADSGENIALYDSLT